MSKKDKLAKEIDELLDEIKFFRNVLFAILSGMIGVLFSYSQNLLKLNFIVEFLLIIGIVSVFFLVFVIYKIQIKKAKTLST